MKDLATSLLYHSQRFYRSLSFTQEALRLRNVYVSQNNFEIYCEILSRKIYVGVTPKVYMLNYWLETTMCPVDLFSNMPKIVDNH